MSYHNSIQAPLISVVNRAKSVCYAVLVGYDATTHMQVIKAILCAMRKSEMLDSFFYKSV